MSLEVKWWKGLKIPEVKNLLCLLFYLSASGLRVKFELDSVISLDSFWKSVCVLIGEGRRGVLEGLWEGEGE